MQHLIKSSLLSALLIAAFGTTAVLAGEGYSIEKKVEKLTKKLELNEEQSSQLTTILEAKKASMDALYEETNSKINALLTPEQQTKYAKMKDKSKKGKISCEKCAANIKEGKGMCDVCIAKKAGDCPECAKSLKEGKGMCDMCRAKKKEKGDDDCSMCSFEPTEKKAKDDHAGHNH